MVAGAPFFLGDGESDGLTPGVSSAPGVAIGVDKGSGDSAGDGVGDGEDLRFFFGEAFGEESGVGVGEDFFFFFGEAEALGSAFSVGVGLAELFFFFFGDEGEGDFSGLADGLGVGDFSASSFFFGAVEGVLRCFRGVGVGVGTKIFFILLPNDSSARAPSATPKNIAIKRKVLAILLTRRMEAKNSTSASDE